MNKKWILKETDPVLKNILARQLHISPLLAQILLNRGIFSAEEAAHFLYADLSSLPDPFLLKDMDRAVERILAALQRREKILVYGDYDADGITGTTLLLQALTRLGARTAFYIPNRLTEGYGLHQKPINRAREMGFTLVITVDCGISGAEVVKRTKASNGPDFIITDHHQVPAELPPALAVINPKRADCPYPYKDLAGVGVAGKLVQALLQKAPAAGSLSWQDYLDLVCLGTVADLVPLLGENRLLVKSGLPRLAGTDRPGLKALLRLTGTPEEKLDTREISFGLAPRLNAAGRMGDAGQAVKLLLATDPEAAGEIAAGLERANQQRQEVEQAVFNEALQIYEGDPRHKDSLILCLASPRFHPGVTGIVASRLVEIFYRPVLLVAVEGELGKGSGRSIPGFHLYKALDHCREHLLAYGGHAQAAGFTLKVSELAGFQQALNEYAARYLPTDLFVPQIAVEAVVSLAEMSEQLVNELNLLVPFGPGNPEPVLACLGATILHLREVGREGSHLKLLLKENGTYRDGIGFRLAGQKTPEIAPGKTVNLAFTPVLDRYNGQVRVQLELKDICPAENPAALALEQNAPPGVTKASPETIIKARTNQIQNPAGDLPAPAAEFFSELLPLPEFAWSWFENYARFPGRVFLPDRFRNSPPVCREAAATFCPDQQASTGLPISDLRNTPAKLSRLVNLIAAGKHIVILTSCPFQAVALAGFLRRCGCRAEFFHPLWPTRGGETRSSSPPGDSPVLVTTAGSLTELPPDDRIDRLIIYHLPFNRQEWVTTLSYAITAGTRQVFLLFGAADCRLMEHYLASLAPDRNSLAHLYILMQHWDTKNKRIEDNLAYFTVALRKRGLPWVQEHTIYIALAIFYELALVKKERHIYLPPAPAQKLNVKNSPTYSWGEREKRQSQNWYQWLLGAPLHEITR